MQAITDLAKLLLLPSSFQMLSTIKINFTLSSLLERPLCCLAFITLIHCSVFKVQSPAFVKARNKYSISLNTYFRAYSDWWARVGSNHRPYDYQSYALAS